MTQELSEEELYEVEVCGENFMHWLLSFALSGERNTEKQILRGHTLTLEKLNSRKKINMYLSQQLCVLQETKNIL